MLHSCFYLTNMKHRRFFLQHEYNSESGQDMVEFALILPIFLLMLCGIIDYGWVMSCQNELTNAAGEAARYAAIYADNEDVVSMTEDFVKRNVSSGTPSIESVSVNDETAEIKLSENVKYLTGFSGIWNGGKNEITLKAEATMPVEPYHIDETTAEDDESEEGS